MIRILSIDPDGVRIVLDKDKIVPGTSVFIPCVDTRKAWKQFRSNSGFATKDLVKRVTIENGYYGIRIWRIK